MFSYCFMLFYSVVRITRGVFSSSAEKPVVPLKSRIKIICFWIFKTNKIEKALKKKLVWVENTETNATLLF